MRCPLILKKFIVLSVLTVFCACGQQPPSHSQDAAPKKPASPSAAVKESSAHPAVKMIADFETADLNDLTNQLGGGSGEWNLNPDDSNDSYTDPLIVKMPGKDGKESQVLSLGYSTDAVSESTQNGFWTKLGGFDASEYDHLQFEVKGDVEKGFPEIFKIEIKKPKPKTEHAAGDAYAAPRVGQVETIKGTARVKVTPEWQTASIPLNAMTGLINFIDPEAWKNPSISRRDLDELVFVFHKRMVTAKTGKIYIDNIRFVKTGNPGPTAVDFPPRKLEKTATRIEGFEFQKFLKTRLPGFPEKAVVKKEFPAEREAFFREVAKDTWKFFENTVDRENGLPLDTIQIAPTGEQAFAEGAWIGDYTNVTNIGVYLMCVVSAYDLKLITREQAVQKLKTILNTLENKLEYHSSGFPYNYYDTTTAERTNYLVSLVDSGWYLAGLYVIRNAFTEVNEQATRLINRGNLSFFYDPVERLMFHGYYEHLKVYSDYNYGVFYSEPRATSFMAIARGDIPKEHWFGGLFRTFPESFDWQGQKPKEQVQKTALGLPYTGGYYTWKDLQYVPSWGGSAFEALMPTLIIKEKELAPEGLGKNDAAQVRGQIRYALEDLGYPVWGMSPSSVPEGGYSEYGAQPFGSKGYKPGVVTPHASALSVEFAPEAVEKNLRKLIELYDIYGEYGFYDAVTVKTGLVARKYLALDQGMILVALNNYINHGAIRDRFHSDPDMKKGEEILTAENLFSAENFKP